jgi:SAM-dependent methyltransferase
MFGLHVALSAPITRLSKAMSRKGLATFLGSECERLTRELRVLSIGGAGLVDELLSRKQGQAGFSWTRFDIEPYTEPDVVGDICDWRLEGRFDVVFMSEVLEHVRRPRAAIDNVYASLAPGGRLVLTVPFLFPIHHQTDDFFRFTRFGLQELLSQFRTVAIVERNSWAETYAVLLARAIKPYNRILKAVSPLAVALAAALYPGLWILGRLAPSRFMTSGYNVVATR